MTKPEVSLVERIEEEVLFFRTWATSPIKIGSVTPTSRALAAVMVKHARPDPAGWTLEIGPGTGVVTQALVDAGIPAERIVSVEYERTSASTSASAFPACTSSAAMRSISSKTLGEFRDVKFSAAISGIPLLNLPKTEARAVSRRRARPSGPGRHDLAALLFLRAAAGGDPRAPRRRQVEMGDVQSAARTGVGLSPARRLCTERRGSGRRLASPSNASTFLRWRRSYAGRRQAISIARDGRRLGSIGRQSRPEPIGNACALKLYDRVL